MKKKIFVFLAIILVISTVYFAKAPRPFNEDLERSKVRGIGEERKIFIQETEPDTSRVTVAPPKCLTNLRGFIGYVFGNTPNLFFNPEEQRKWLAADLRKVIDRQLRTFESGSLIFGETSYFPDNSSFIGAWEYPSHYQIADSRKNGENAEIDVYYIWKEGLNYQGATRKVTFFFVFEDEDWKIRDIYHHQSEFNSAFRLSDPIRDYWFK